MPDNQDEAADELLEKLRHLIIQPELDNIAELQQRLDNKARFTDEISKVLPEAIIHRNGQDKKIDKALLPVIEDSIRTSVTNDLSFFADALYPIMGPAIRKSIAETFKELLQAVNVALDNSFSKQGLLWRWESIRTGKPFAEIVLLRSLVYRAEQVFLIHRETGNLLQHVAINIDDDVHDADMVSGMLTAISDFAQDSFAIQKKSVLDSFQIDDLTILVEAGPMAVLAIAIRGDAPETVRDILHTALESIHFTQRKNLTHYKGDVQPFEQSRPYLEECLQSQYKKKETGPLLTWPVAVVLATVVLLVCWWMFSTYQENVNWNHYLDKLRQEPGIVITGVTEQSDHFIIQGLRDPLAKRPQSLRTDATPIAKEDISYHLEPYQSLTPKFILQRASKTLAKPERVSFGLNNSTLVAKGVASEAWQIEARKLARLIAGVDAYDDAGIVIHSDIVVNPNLSSLQAPEAVTLTLKDKTLFAIGSAPHQWILQTRKKVLAIAGIQQYDDSELKTIERLKIKELIAQLEQRIILFQASSFAKSVQNGEVDSALDDIKQLLQLGKIVNRQVSITVLGHTDSIGSDKRNLVLSQQRAHALLQYLVRNGVSKSILHEQGVGESRPLGKSPLGVDKHLNRSVTFAVQIY